MGTRSSPGVSQIRMMNTSLITSLQMNPSLEICKFTNPEIKNLAPCFPPETVFRPFDPSARSDAISRTWFCFPASHTPSLTSLNGSSP
ncbi:hypothetical protein Hanom_Chr06g00545151 [Helianthus anomalus]